MMMMMAVRDVPLHVIREQIASAVNVIVQVDRLTGGPRRVTSITEVMGCTSDVITTQELFRFKQLGVTSAGNAHGTFEAAGIPSCNLQRIHSAGIALPLSIFHDGDPIEA
jgi:pilus assembly protein CpaF